MNGDMITTKYGYSFSTPLSFGEAVAKVKATFVAEGFGVLSEIDVAAKMNEKLGKDMEEYTILGMCNPKLAYEALGLETEIGLLLPCNVIVYQKDGETVVAAQRPDVMLGVTGNEAVAVAATIADEKIKNAMAVFKG